MYPYVVVRYMATVYGSFPVRFVDSDQTNLKSEEFDDVFVVICPQRYATDEKLTPQARKALLDVVQDASKQSRHKMCAVFASDECVFMEPDGAAKLSTEPPSGGIQGLRFPIRLKET